MITKVAVTGGIGVGKTLVCEIFKKLGIPVFNADFVGKQLLDSDTGIKQKIVSLFGNGIYLPNGAVNRKKLAEMVFNNQIALEKLNGIVHPVVRKNFQNWAQNQQAPYVIQESAIIFESKISGIFDKIVTVTAPFELRVTRVMKRDNVSGDKVIERMKNQLPEEEKIKQSDYIIVNSGKEMILPQIINIHNSLI
jgi:dephospho-CoA kinase